MRKSWRYLLVALTGCGFLIGASLWLVYRASQQVPEFYQRAVAADPQVQEQASQQMLAQATSLVNEARKQGTWEAEFTDEQINGWLAVDLEKNHPNTLPPEVSDPRVSITPDGVSLGCRWDGEGLSSVFSLQVDLYLAEANTIALRVHGASAGVVPLPLARVLDGVSEAARQLGLPIRWLRADDDPVAMITIPPPAADEETELILDTLELRAGSVYLAGRTMTRSAATEPADPGNSPVRLLQTGMIHPAFKVKIQR